MLRRLAHAALLKAERLLEMRQSKKRTAGYVDTYVGYATPTHFIARGRVLSENRMNQVHPGQSRLSNLWHMLKLFMTNEISGTHVRAQEGQTITDDEGYFQLTLPKTRETGWLERDVIVDGMDAPVKCPLYVTPNNAEYLIISDIDDTVLHTRAYSLWRNLFTSLSGSVLTRVIYPDAVRLMERLSKSGRNPVFYVSSSPWNLYAFLNDLFKRADLTRGPMFLRDLGLDENKFVTHAHGNHKNRSIDRILDANPHLRAVLIGDTGQEDATIYRAAVERHSDRIAAVVLRESDPHPMLEEIMNRERLQALPIPTFVTKDFGQIETPLLNCLAQVEPLKLLEIKTL